MARLLDAMFASVASAQQAGTDSTYDSVDIRGCDGGQRQ